MNYVGSISILDRGDAPAQAIIDRNARSLAQRMADETRDELSKVMSRVHTIYGAMDTAEDLYPTTASMEYLNDLAELEAILKDEIKKRQYQQQVTVFIVGYQDVCHQKLVLLQQVNEFFMENSKRIDEEDWFPTTPDIDLDEMSSTVEESLSHAHELTNRLSDLNKEMVDYMANLAERKASNKGRKKIEKALQQAKDEVSGLSEKLLALQTELDDREEKVQTMFKQLESKNMEVQKFRTAAELAKQKIILLQKELEEQKSSNEETKADLTRLLDNQINALHESHRQEMEELKKQHQTEAKQLKEEVEESRQLLARSQHELIQLQIDKGVHSDTPSEVGRVLDLDSEASQQASRQSSKQESRPSTKDTKVSSKSLTSGGKQGKTGARSPTRSYKAGDSKPGSRTSGPRSDGKEFAEVAIQDEGGDPVTATVDEKVRTPATRQSRRSKSTLAPVLESDFDSAFDLMDEPSWAAVPSDQLTGRFAQYRRLSTHRLQELEEQLQLNTARTKRKVSTLKAQFQEHKSKWEAERKVLIEQVDQSLRLQSDAEKEADAAMTQLEDFISEQERLEQEEDVKRSEVLQVSASLTPLDALSPTQGSSAHTPTAGSPHPPHTIPPSPESEQELQRLMQQTDDAKVQEMNARLGSCVSAPPAVDMGALPQTRPPPQRARTDLGVPTVAQAK
ncbi:cingulin, partial [Aplysia californica]|uniref:Cingulin n=1 Tax=Aplysia californica TaxID=6500 RepID=A0ABM1W4C6_APLCA